MKGVLQTVRHTLCALHNVFHFVHTGDSPGPDPLRQLAPPPPLEIGWKVPDHGCRRRPKENLLDLVEVEKLGFHPMCLYSKHSVS